MASALLSFFIILFAGLFFSEIFNRFHLSWVIALIFAGVAIGPFGISAIAINDSLLFIAEIGLVFLMFMAGLEARLSSFAGLKKEIVSIALLSATIPFFTGIAIGYTFGLGQNAAILLGIIFISSSVAVVVPTLTRAEKLSSKIGQIIVDTTIVLDIASLFLLSIVFQSTGDLSPIPPFILYPIILFVFATLRWITKYMQQLVEFLFEDESKTAHELQVILVMVLGAVVVFQLLGLHPIVGGFLAGLILSDSVSKNELKSKLAAMSYGLFIPIFFIVLGAQLDLSVFKNHPTLNATALTLALILGLTFAKFISGWIGAKINKIKGSDAMLLAAAGIPQLSTTLAVAFSGFELGILSEELVTSLVLLSAATTLIGPLLMKYVVNQKN